MGTEPGPVDSHVPNWDCSSSPFHNLPIDAAVSSTTPAHHTLTLPAPDPLPSLSDRVPSPLQVGSPSPSPSPSPSSSPSAQSRSHSLLHPTLLAAFVAAADPRPLLDSNPTSAPHAQLSHPPHPPSLILSAIDPALTSAPTLTSAPALPSSPHPAPLYLPASSPSTSASLKSDPIDVNLFSLSKPAYPSFISANTDRHPPPVLTSEMVEHSLTPIRIGKNWACRICHRQFTRRFNCTTHERTHLDLNERAQYQCVLCSRAFTRRHDLERHIHSVHPGHILEKEPPGPSGRLPITILPTFFPPTSLPSKRKSNGGASPTVKIRRLEDGEIMGKDECLEEDSSRIVVIDRAAPEPFLIDPSLSLPSANPYALLLSANATGQRPTAILTTGSIRDVSQAVERVALEALPALNPLGEPIFKVDKKWACATCGRLFVRRNNCKAHEATHRDIREHECPTCSRSFSRRHDLERHITAIHPPGGFLDHHPVPRSLSPQPPPSVRAKPVSTMDPIIGLHEPVDEKSFNIFETFPVTGEEEQAPKKQMEIDPSLDSTLEDVRQFVWGGCC
ncbi:hypothetical protein CROQUDRAFT_650763 [Cronartium quercuum f. sp. fusiforme G11]|uniref:C2H2-type domain-containing protein n=1 Tax=Cronartium quercuum f. sp. fusiforme G11 TaxID=708437 RepID=A0A9P6TGR5_9BASI|nr:hypothetical protein CROQUDRAFT_650763 [Cronartium quercuum f. sp. fusiforme G11]